MRKSNRLVDRKSWLDDARQAAAKFLRPENAIVIDGQFYPPLWWINYEIRIFCEHLIHKATAHHVAQAVDIAIKKFGIPRLDLKVIGVHDNSTANINQALDGQSVDWKKLFQILLAEEWRDPKRGGRQHGDILLLNRYFHNDLQSWGQASFAHGTIALALPGNRQDQAEYFLKNIVPALTCKLLGYQYDCGSPPAVKGYSDNSECVLGASGRMSAGLVKSKCQDWLREFWRVLAKHKEAL